MRCKCGYGLRSDWKHCPACGASTGIVDDKVESPSECGLCKAKLPSGTTKCSKCGRIVKDFKRLCPYCKKVIGLTDDSCRHCGKQFPITIDKLPQIVCGSCGRSEEIDDWFGFRNLPFLFQTERGVKVGCFKDKEIALKNYKLFFEHSKRPETHRDEMDISEDEKPWSFRDKQTAQMFVNAFPCPSLNCGGKNWKLSIFKRFWGAAPSAERIGKGVGTGFLGLGKILTSARKTIELATKPKQETKSEKPEKGGKK